MMIKKAFWRGFACALTGCDPKDLKIEPDTSPAGERSR